MTPTIMLVLSGVVVSSIFNAGVSTMKYLADPENDLPAITFWLMGSLSGCAGTTWPSRPRSSWRGWWW